MPLANYEVYYEAVYEAVYEVFYSEHSILINYIAEEEMQSEDLFII